MMSVTQRLYIASSPGLLSVIVEQAEQAGSRPGEEASYTSGVETATEKWGG